MPTRSPIGVSSLIVLFLSTALFAQQQVTARSAAPDAVRFTSPGNAAHIRVEVFASDGVLVFDSGWRDGNVFDWQSEIANGSYRCQVMTRDLEGGVTQKEMHMTAADGQISIAQPADVAPSITMLAHDGTSGMVVNTHGDLTFRFGDFLARKDSEQMRLTADGDLHVAGTISAGRGILLPDGTVVASASDVSTNQSRIRGAVTTVTGLERQQTATSNRLTPRPTFTPGFQFVTTDTGVNIGTTNPAYNLDVTGYINTVTQYNLGGVSFAHTHGLNNTFVGISAGNFTGTGSSNAAFGNGALTAYTDGGSNTAVGRLAMNGNTSGHDNAAVGRFALGTQTSGFNNAAFGADAMSSANSGNNNTAIGAQTLLINTGNNNVAIGTQAFANKVSGDGNLAIGPFAGSAVTTGSSTILIGNPGVDGESNTMRIGNSSLHFKTFMAGIFGVTTGSGQNTVPVVIDNFGQLGTVASSRSVKFDIEDMDRTTDDLMRLRPVTFRYIAHGANAPLQYGLIAEEVADVYPELVARSSDGKVSSVMYQFLPPMLLNEVQKQHQKIEEQQRTIDTLEARLAELARRLESIEAKR
ncbi:MAG TPA: tail fiber domain-containing protein [Thermoanaerobaculia bacterium]